MSCSDKVSLDASLLTPALASCSSNAGAGIFSSVANWETVIKAMRYLSFFFGEPVGTRNSDQRRRPFGIDAGHFNQLVGRQVRQ